MSLMGQARRPEGKALARSLPWFPESDWAPPSLRLSLRTKVGSRLLLACSGRQLL
jgi:hypothetical protein